MAEKKKKTIEFLNKRASFEYIFVETLEVGIVLRGTEMKAIRGGKVNMSDCYCTFENGELYIRSLYVAEYENGTYFNHDARRMRKLLLRKSEMRKWEKKVKERGLTIVPVRMYMSERGFMKLEIALAQGKNIGDKREAIKAKESKRELDRIKKAYAR